MSLSFCRLRSSISQSFLATLTWYVVLCVCNLEMGVGWDEVDSDNNTSEVGMIFSELYLRPLMKVWMSRSQNLTLVLNHLPYTQLPLSVGCTKEECYRKALAKAAKLMKNGQDVPCVLYPEPHNPVDARAIAFKL